MDQGMVVVVVVSACQRHRKISIQTCIHCMKLNSIVFHQTRFIRRVILWDLLGLLARCR